MIKVFGLITRRADFSLAAFSAYWRTVHLQEALKLSPFIAHYVQNHFWAEPLPGLRRPADGCPELWFDDPAKIAAMHESAAYKTGAYLDEPRFMEGRADGVAMREQVLSPPPNAPAVKAMFLYTPAEGVSLSTFTAALDAQPGAPLVATTGSIGHVRSFALPADAPPAYAGADELWWATQAEFEADWAARPAAPAYVDARRSAGCRVDELRVF